MVNIHIENFKTKKDFEQLLLNMLNPLKPYYSKGNAGLHIGHTSAHYENKTVPMEAFARPLWALVPFFAGGGSDREFEEIYRRGIAEGTNPDSDEYWGKCREYDQRFVEMASIAYGMLLAPDKVWDPLSAKEKENLVNWLNEINHYECYMCNWQFFCILVNVALKKQGMAYSRERMENGLLQIDAYYDGDGWYKDGGNGQKDYYVAFAIHFYSIVYAAFMEDEDRERCEIYKERAKIFAGEFIYWFAEDGSSLPYGRSLTYRFAQVSFFSACAAFNLAVLPISVMKGIIVRHLNDWLSAPIFDKVGLLTIGYKYPNLSMSESYNAPGSPYWGMKVFAFLALPEDDEFWSAETAPLPELSAIKMIANGDMIVTRKCGHVTAFVPGSKTSHLHTHTEEKYSKFAYSTKYGFNISRSQKTFDEAAPDSVLAFEVLGHIFVKGKTDSYEVNDNRIKMNWSPIDGIHVCTEIMITPDGHTRSHEIDSEYDCKAYDSGFSVSTDDLGEPFRKFDKNGAYVKNGDAYCMVELVCGSGTGKVTDVSPNTNLIYPKTAIPAIEYEIKKGYNKLVTKVVYT